MLVDFDGRILSQADPGPGEKIVVGPIDLATLRAERERRQGHHMLAHLRQEMYSGQAYSVYPPFTADHEVPSILRNERHIQQGRQAYKSYRGNAIDCRDTGNH